MVAALCAVLVALAQATTAARGVASAEEAVRHVIDRYAAARSESLPGGPYPASRSSMSSDRTP